MIVTPTGVGTGATLADFAAGTMRLTGGTMTGPVVLAADPAVALQPATKQYVDTISNVAATGTSTARTLASRFMDEVSVEDQGVVNDPTGVHVAANTAAYQAILNNFAGVARIRHRAGLAVVATALTVPSNADLELDGLLKLAPGATTSFITISGSNLRISGTGTIDGNKSAAPGASAGITTSGTPSNITLEDITITNCVNWPFNLNGSGHRVRGVRASNSGHSCEFVVGAVDCHAEGLSISGIGDVGFSFYGGNTDCSITGSRVTGCRGQGISVLSDLAQSGANTRIVISGNICTYNGYEGISVQDSNSGASTESYINVTGNICLYNSQVSNVSSIDVLNGKGVRIANNICGLGGTSLGPSFGITVDVNSSRCTVSGNTVFNEGQGTTAGVGIVILGSYTVVSDNYVYDDQSTKTLQHAFSGTAGVGCVFTNNRMGPTLGTAFNVTAAADTIIDQYNSVEGAANVRTVNGSLVVGGTAEIVGNLTVDPGGLIKGFQGPSINGLTSFGAGKAGAYLGWDLEGGGQVNLLSFPQGATIQKGEAGFSVYQMTYGGLFNSTTPIMYCDGVGNGSFLLSVAVGGASGPTWTTGTAAPTAVAPVGSMYSRVGGAIGATLYVSRGGGTWAAVAGV
jgi:hypothetical protein